MTDSGLQLGTEGRVAENRRVAGLITVDIAGVQKNLGLEAAEKLLVSDLA